MLRWNHKSHYSANAGSTFRNQPLRYRTPSWKDGVFQPQPTSTVQSIFLSEINSNKIRSNFGLPSKILQQVHQGRISRKSKRGQSLSKDVILNMAGLVKTTCKDYFSPHFVISTTTKSGKELGMLENKFYWRLSGAKSKTLTLGDLEPSSKETDFRILYTVRTSNFGKFYEDFDGFYPPWYPPGDDKLLRLWHPAVFMIPKDGKGLKVFNMDTGERHGVVDADVEFGDVTCHENKNITIGYKKNSLGKDVLAEFLLGTYPPLKLATHVQVLQSSVKGKRGCPQDLVIYEDYFVLHYKTNQLELYDLEDVLGQSALEEVTGDGITHQVTQLPTPLVAFSSSTSDMDNPHASFWVVHTSKGIQIQAVSVTGPIPVEFDDGKVNMFDEDAKVNFLKTNRFQLLVRHQCSVKIYRIFWKDADSSSTPYLKCVFDKCYKKERDEKQTPEASGNTSRRTLRNLPKKSYVFDADVVILYAENHFLNQLAIARFTENSVCFYVYNIVTFEEVYQISVKHFQPKASEVYDPLELHFPNHFIAVERKGSSDSSLYVLNLVTGEKSDE